MNIMNRIKKKSLIISLFSVFFVMGLSSCSLYTAGGNDSASGKANYVITINEVVRYPRALKEEIRVPTFDGRTIWVKRNPIISSRSIESVRLIESRAREDYFDLVLKLDRHGKLAAMKLVNDKVHSPWAFLIDGMYYRSTSFKLISSKKADELLVEGPFDNTIADLLSKYAKKNYKFYHPEG